MRRIDLAVLHHSASPRDATTLEDIDAWHRARGWNGVGYHFVLEGDGTLRHGRPVEEEGAHARGQNAHSLGVCLVGDNTRTGEGWSEAQWSALHGLLVALRTVWPGLRVVAHRDLAATACPGLDVAGLGLGEGLALQGGQG